MNKDIIIGANGQIGKAIYKCYEDDNKPLTFDVSDKDKLRDCALRIKPKINCMHICFPFFNKDQFIDAVIGYIDKYKPKIVIIHSTVPPGTTREIFKHENKNIMAIAHSPCTGVHPHLFESIKFVFSKIFGAIGLADGIGLISDVLIIDMGIKDVEQYNSPEETEMTKMLSTTVYAHHIAIVTEINRICEEHGLDFHNVFTKWTKNYNQGYKKLDKKHFIRPLLKPCKEGELGGHCIRENIILMEKYMPKTWLTDLKPKRLLGK